MSMTVKGIGVLPRGKALSESLGRGAGTLRAVGVGAGRVAFQFRYTRSDGRRDDLPIGAWSERGSDGGLTLAEARQRARVLAAQYAGGDRDLRQSLGLERAKALQTRKASEVARELREDPDAVTLGALFEAYVQSLQQAEKFSARAVGNALRLHVATAFPVLWATPAKAVSLDDLVEVVHRLVEAGSLTEARKIRSYIRAAFSAAVAARQSPSAPASLRALRITTNPARDLATVRGGAQVRDRALLVPELRAYWRRIAKGREHAVLRFHLLSGGQRIEQLSRATLDDWEPESRTLRLLDPKGRREKPRAHYVPLLPIAVEAMSEMDAGKLGPHVFTLTAGRSGVDYGGIRARLKAVTEAMAIDGELVGSHFTAGDLRRTVETRLAALGVSTEVRAQLQSHGLSGVQARHYIRHDFLQEKRMALQKFFCLLEPKRSSEPRKLKRSKTGND